MSFSIASWLLFHLWDITHFEVYCSFNDSLKPRNSKKIWFCVYSAFCSCFWSPFASWASFLFIFWAIWKWLPGKDFETTFWDNFRAFYGCWVQILGHCFCLVMHNPRVHQDCRLMDLIKIWLLCEYLSGRKLGKLFSCFGFRAQNIAMPARSMKLDLQILSIHSIDSIYYTMEESTWSAFFIGH
mgnify:CR=1 FL=1